MIWVDPGTAKVISCASANFRVLTGLQPSEVTGKALHSIFSTPLDAMVSVSRVFNHTSLTFVTQLRMLQTEQHSVL